MEIKNCSTLAVRIYDEDGNFITKIKRDLTFPFPDCITTTVFLGEINDIPIYEIQRKVINLPEPHADTIFVVYPRVQEAVPERKDVFQPGELVFNVNGHVMGYSGLAQK